MFLLIDSVVAWTNAQTLTDYALSFENATDSLHYWYSKFKINSFLCRNHLCKFQGIVIKNAPKEGDSTQRLRLQVHFPTDPDELADLLTVASGANRTSLVSQLLEQVRNHSNAIIIRALLIWHSNKDTKDYCVF
jgi:hypothetical protein